MFVDIYMDHVHWGPKGRKAQAGIRRHSILESSANSGRSIVDGKTSPKPLLSFSTTTTGHSGGHKSRQTALAEVFFLGGTFKQRGCFEGGN